jgi:CheY-like chemotaxis protein
LATRVEHRLGTYRLERLEEHANEELVPDGKPAFALPAVEVQRLIAWASGSSDTGADSYLLLVGAERVIGRLRVALGRLSLRLDAQEDAPRALMVAEVDRPDLVIVAHGAQGMDERELLRALRRLHQPDELPILLSGSHDAAAEGTRRPARTASRTHGR